MNNYLVTEYCKQFLGIIFVFFGIVYEQLSSVSLNIFAFWQTSALQPPLSTGSLPPCVSSSFAIHPPAEHSLICSLPCQSNASVQQTILSRRCGDLPVPGTDSRYRECFQTAFNRVFCFISFFSLILFLKGNVSSLVWEEGKKAPAS